MVVISDMAAYFSSGNVVTSQYLRGTNQGERNVYMYLAALLGHGSGSLCRLKKKDKDFLSFMYLSGPTAITEAWASSIMDTMLEERIHELKAGHLGVLSHVMPHIPEWLSIFRKLGVAHTSDLLSTSIPVMTLSYKINDLLFDFRILGAKLYCLLKKDRPGILSRLMMTQQYSEVFMDIQDLGWVDQEELELPEFRIQINVDNYFSLRHFMKEQKEEMP